MSPSSKNISLIPKIESAAIHAYNTVATMLHRERSQKRTAPEGIYNIDNIRKMNCQRKSRFDKSTGDLYHNLERSESSKRLLLSNSILVPSSRITPTKRMPRINSENPSLLYQMSSQFQSQLQGGSSFTPNRISSSNLPILRPVDSELLTSDTKSKKSLHNML
jgi:hypothetical protein